MGGGGGANIVKTQPFPIFTERKELKPFTTENFIYSNVQKRNIFCEWKNDKAIISAHN